MMTMMIVALLVGIGMMIGGVMMMTVRAVREKKVTIEDILENGGAAMIVGGVIVIALLGVIAMMIGLVHLVPAMMTMIGDHHVASLLNMWSVQRMM